MSATSSAREASLSLQDRYAPNNRCFGCGPANTLGLRIKSHARTDDAGARIVVADFVPEAHHLAFDGIVNGGILGAILDCHSNWAACHRLMVDRALDAPPCTVTADFHVKLKRPTPMGLSLNVVARAIEVDGDKVVVDATVTAGGKITATCLGTFVAVRDGHPAYHRW
jgi:acyl-coenzyme A thioesterase PaaI-like protein